MKRIYSLFLLLFFAFNAHSQVLFTESFETSVPPPGWALYNAGTSPENWAQYSSAVLTANGINGAQDGANVAGLLYDAANAANGWLMTPKYPLTAGTSYTLSFYYQVADATYPEKMKVTVGSDTLVSTQTTVLWDNGGAATLTNITWLQATVNYTPTTTGSYSFGFNCYSDANEYLMMLDNVRLEVTPSSVPPCTTLIAPANGATGIDPNAVTLTWHSSPGATSYNIYLGLSAPPTTLLLTIPDTTITLSGGATNTTYYWAIVPANAAGPATACTGTSWSFTTVGAPPNDTVCNAIPLVLNGPSDCQNTALADATDADDPSTFSCSTPNNTLWYKYTPTVSGPVGIKMKSTGSGGTQLNAWVGVFTATGTCPSLTLTQDASGCLNADLTTNDSVTLYTASLTAGTTYYFMVDGYSGATGEYCISLFLPPTPPPCATLIAPVNGAINVSAPTATFSWGAVTGVTGYVFMFGTSAPLTALGTTPDTTTSVPISGLSFSTTYYWSIVPTNNGLNATGCPIDSFTTMAAPPPPPNDSCGAPVAVYLNTPVAGTTISATQSMPDEMCAGFTGTADDDVWYKVTAVTNGDITITEDPDPTFDGIIQVYTGSCGSFTNIGCADAGIGGDQEVVTLTNVTAGTTYYFRIYSYGGAASDAGTFTVTVTGSALPVSLASFKGARDGSANVLSWTTISEHNSRGFELQRSADGTNFTSLAFVETKANNGNSSATLNYGFADSKPFAGNSYYRLKQMDKDGKSTLSNVVLIKGDKVNALLMSAVYPNPAKTKVNVVLTAPASQKVTLVLTDLAGKVVMQQQTQLAGGDNNITLAIDNLPSGTYMLKAICSNGCETAGSKVVKQ